MSWVLRAYGVNEILDAYIMWYIVCGVTVGIVGIFMWQRHQERMLSVMKSDIKLILICVLKSNEFDSFLRSQMWTMHSVIFTFIPCSILMLSKFYLFTNWCISELSQKTILKFTLKLSDMFRCYSYTTISDDGGVTVIPKHVGAVLM